MMRRTPMKRSGWKRTPREKREVAAEKPAPTLEPVKALRRGTYTPIEAVAPAPKENVIRSEAYRRLVAKLPCKYCGLAGHSQCAHSNTGKGMGIKASDLDSFPLCADRPEQRGCHSLFDQGALLGKLERKLMETAWVRDTQRQIYAMGLWPKNLPIPESISVK